MSTGCDKLSRPDRAIIGDPTYSRECMKLDVSINFHALKACSIKHSIVTRPPADSKETPIYSSLYSFASHALLRKQIHSIGKSNAIINKFSKYFRNQHFNIYFIDSSNYTFNSLTMHDYLIIILYKFLSVLKNYRFCTIIIIYVKT